MGACASKFNVLKDSDDAPPPAPAEEVASREVTVVEEVVEKDEGATAADEEAKRQSFGHLLNEKGSAEDLKEAEADKTQENENVKSLEPVADEKAPASTDGVKPVTSDEKKTEDVKPARASQSVEAEASQKKIEEKPAEIAEVETQVVEKPAEATKVEKKEEDKQVVEPVKTEKDEKSVTGKKTEDQKPVLDAGEEKTEK